MNIDQVKKEFPIFDEKIQNNDLVYLIWIIIKTMKSEHLSTI